MKGHECFYDSKKERCRKKEKKDEKDKCKIEETKFNTNKKITLTGQKMINETAALMRTFRP